MDKIDLKKELKHLYRPSSKTFVVVDVPPMQFLMVDGHGDPNTAPAYQDAVEALYAVAYKLKFLSKRQLEKKRLRRAAAGGPVVGRRHGHLYHQPGQECLGLDDDDHAARVDHPGDV